MGTPISPAAVTQPIQPRAVSETITRTPVEEPSNGTATSPFQALDAPVAQPKSGEEEVSPPSYWLDGALPAEDDIKDGTWIWEPEYFPEGTMRVHSHPSGKGVQFHGFRNSPIHMVGHPMITQEVWLDPSDPPRGIMVKFVLTSGDEIGVYWEGEEEVFFPLIEKEGPMEIWYYGMLPELGKWTPLTILAEDLALENQDVVGLKFVTYDGRAVWGRTSVSEAPAPEESNPEIIAKKTEPSAS